MKSYLLPKALYPFLSVFWIILCSFTTLRAQGGYEVTASDYCLFLNEVATTDAEHLYDEKMGSDPVTASIVREGTPGDYRYFVIATREKEPISFVNEKDKAAYGEWLASQESEKTAEDQEATNSKAGDEADEPKSNRTHLEVVALTPLLTLSTGTTSNASSFSFNDFNDIEKVGAVVGAVALFSLCPELMIRREGGGEPPTQAQEEGGAVALSQQLGRELDDSGSSSLFLHSEGGFSDAIPTERENSKEPADTPSSLALFSGRSKYLKRSNSESDLEKLKKENAEHTGNDLLLKKQSPGFRNQGQKSEEPGSDDSEHSTDSLEGRTSNESKGSHSLKKRGSKIPGEERKPKKVSFAAEIVSQDELKREEQAHASLIQNFSEYRVEAMKARRDRCEEEAKHWEKAFSYGQKYSQYHVSFKSALEAEKQLLVTKDAVLLWREVLNHTEEFINQYVGSAKGLREGISSSSPLKGKVAALEDILGHRVNAALYKMRAEEARITGRDEEATLWEQACSHSTQAAETRAYYKKQESERWAEAAKKIAAKAENYQKEKNPLKERDTERKAPEETKVMSDHGMLQQQGDPSSMEPGEKANHTDNQQLNEILTTDVTRQFVISKRPAIETEENREERALWDKAIEQLNILEGLKNKLDESKSAVNQLASSYLSDACAFTQQAANNFSQAAHAMAPEASKNKERSQLFVQVANHAKLASDYFEKAAEFQIQGNERKAINFSNAGKSAGQAVEQFKKAISYADQADKEREGGDDEVADLSRQAARKVEIIASYYMSAAKNRSLGYNQKAEASDKSINNVTKVAQAIIDAITLKKERVANNAPELAQNKRYDNAIKLQSSAYGVESVAFDSYVQFLDCQESQIEKEKALQNAKNAKVAWEQVVTALNQGLENAPEKFKKWWACELNRAEERKSLWNSALELYDSKDNLPSENELKKFPYARVIDVREQENVSKPGKKRSKRILRTLSYHPYILIDEEIQEVNDSVRKLFGHSEMLADQLIITLREGEAPEVFQKKLEDQLRRLNLNLAISIEREGPTLTNYRLSFRPIPDSLNAKKEPTIEAFDAVLKATKYLTIRREPNFLSHLCATPDDPEYGRQWHLSDESVAISAPKS